jgi:TolB-like protein/Tfp pilus assembly protein PilF
LLEKDKELRFQSAEGVIADLKKLQYDSQQTSISRPPQTRRRWPIAAVSLAAVAVLIAGYFGLAEQFDAVTDSDSVPMIAVLPFENLGAADDQYFADGMTEEITSRLAGITGLGVISRTSAAKYKGTDKNLQQIGDELGVDYILEGTVRWSKVGGQPKVRITPQLVRVSDDRHLWADNYERELMEVFAVQADIAVKIVDQLGLTLVAHDRSELAQQPTDNPDAYAFYLKAIADMKTADLEQSEWRRVVDLLDSAISLDPGFAHAYAYKSIAHSWLAFGFGGALGDMSHSGLALQTAQEALDLAPGLPNGHRALGTYYNLIERDYDRALEEFSRAKSEMHNNADLMSSIALVHWRQGRFEDAQEHYRKSIELDPLSAIKHFRYSKCLSFTRDYAESIKEVDRAIILQPDEPEYYASKMQIILHQQGDLDAIRHVVIDASDRFEPVELISRGFWQYHLMDISLDSLIRYQLQSIDSSDTELEKFVIRATAYLASEQADLAIPYCDSAKSIVEKRLREVPDEYGLHMGMGLSLACLGDYEEAIKHGQKAKELMSIDDCHW